ncbi:N(4)-(Beta-N-acetylglucosaminyl)-L-asparaginase, partial [Biomphalaria pfeifferi]
HFIVTGRMTEMVAVGTWAFSEAPVLKALEVMSQGGSSIDAVETGINLAETDMSYGKYHVGCSGWQNSENVLQLDAAIMDGKDLNFGSVTALEGFSKAVSVARRVMSHSPHSMLSGDGAAVFAKSQGFKHEPNLGTPCPKLQTQSPGHDTLGLLAMDVSGNLCAGVSTSGMSGKHPGRVGDSALPGCGLYADSLYGAACCSGDGDKILRFCPAYKVVDLLKQGNDPMNACQIVAREIVKRRSLTDNFEMVIIALDCKGQVGAANVGIHSWTDPGSGQLYPGFPYVVSRVDQLERAVINVVTAYF